MMTLVQPDSILLQALKTLEQRKEGNELIREMILLSGYKILSMWATAARTFGTVREKNNDNKSTQKERSKTIRQTQDLSHL